MKRQLLTACRGSAWVNRGGYPLWMAFMVSILFTTGIASAQNYGTPTRYESENGFNSNVTTASTYSGYSGSGYVTGLITSNSETKFDKGVNSVTPTKIDIRYANGSATTVTNLALYIGSNQKIQDLVFPSTGSWSTWATITVTFDHNPSWGSNIIIKSTSSVAASANIDYSELSVDDGSLPAAATPSFSPTAGTYSSTQSVTLSTSTSGATIRYTTDGSTPTGSSSVYSTPVTVASSQTIKAIAIKSGMSNSGVGSAQYTISLPAVNTATFSPVAGTYTSTQYVTLSTTTSGATIYYTTNGSTPTTSSSVYSTPIAISSTQTVKAIAAKSGMSNSPVSSALYTINLPAVATPTFSPAGGTYSSTQSVTISTTTSGATIYYTTDGSTPSTSSTLYSTPLTVSSSQTVKALAGKSGMSNSGVGSAVYTIGVAIVATPTFSPGAGTYSSAQSVTISSTTSGATIYYTTDGSTPTTSSAVFATPIAVGSTQTIKALATKSGMANSPVASASYTISGPTPAPGIFSLAAPASGATSVSRTPTFTWGASSDAASYELVVATNSAYTSPVINVSGLSAPSYSQTSALAAGTQFYWKVSASNGTGSTIASNAGIVFTTTTGSVGGGTGTLLREYWAGISGQSISALTGNSNYPNNPTSTSTVNSFDAPRNVGDDYGQRIRGYLTPQITGSYLFWIAGDNDVELWLSTTDQVSNKIRIAYSNGYTNPEEWTKSATQASAGINLIAGNTYYIEALHKEFNQGDHLSVAWQAPGGSRVIIPGSVLSTTIPAPVPFPSAFTQSAPANGATGVSKNPTFTWGPSSDAASYTLVVSTSSSFSNPAINVAGLTGTTYTTGTSLAYNTLYYWKVAAVNITGTRVATNSGISFTSAPQSQPGAFNLTAPAGGATGVTTFPTFTWGESLNANSYALVVSTNSSYTSPIVNVSGLNALNYSLNTPLEVSTTYYWKVTATNEVGSRIATNAGISFTTAATSGTSYYVSPTGVDNPGNGLTPSTPWRTLAYAASQVTAGVNGNKTIRLAAGTYTETEPVVLKVGVNITGSGEANTILRSSGVTIPPTVDPAAPSWKLYYDGSLIQLISQTYSGTNPRYGSPAEMVAATDGNQTLSGFTIDGMGRQLKAGVWVESRNNVTMHHVTIKDCKMRGAVFAKSDMYWYVPIPDGKWMYNTTIYNCTFINTGSDISQESLGNLCLAGLDGADIYNITINENQGYGIKFIFVGHFRNVKIHDCNITVPEVDPLWNEDISMELWNFSYNNEIYNIVCNTWLSLVNHVQLTQYQPTPANPRNILVKNVRMIDNDGVSVKEAIEVALSGVDITESYFQDKGFGIAIWGGKGWGGTVANHDITVRNNIFTSINRTPRTGFGNTSAVFIPANVQAYNIKIYNNVIDNMWHGLQPEGSTGTDIRNNAFLNTQGYDVLNGGSLVINNNLKYHTNSAKANWSLAGGPTLGSGNVLGLPGFKNTGNRWDDYYKPSSAGSFAVDRGINVGIPFVGNNPDIGRWEFGATGGGGSHIAFPQSNEAKVNDAEFIIRVYPNPTRGIVTIEFSPEFNFTGLEVLDAQGRTLIVRSKDQTKVNQIDLSQYSNELYFIKVIHSGGVITRKIMLAH